MTESPHIVEVSAANFQQVVLDGSFERPVLVDFWAEWCGPCKMLMPVLAQLADAYAGKFLLAKVNTEENQDLATQFGIRGIPAVKLFRNGQPVDEFTGALPESEVRVFLERHIPRESDSLIARAEQLWADGDAAGAVALARRAAEDSQNSRAALALARLQAASGDAAGARQTLDALPANEQLSDEFKALDSRLTFSTIAETAPPRAELERALAADEKASEARYQLAARLVLENDYEGALEHLLALMKSDRKFGDDAARKAMVQVFEILGDHPAVGGYRSRMMNLLY
jgi:putative thioredoxin